MIRRDEWPILAFGAVVAAGWTAASLYWLMTAGVRIAPHNPLEWVRIAILLPGVISVMVGQALYQSGAAPEEVGIAIGVATAVIITCAIALTVERRA